MGTINPDNYSASMFGVGQAPNPWFTIANQFLPRNLHDIIRWAQYITSQSPVTTEVIRKLVTYPVTDFIVSTEDESTKRRYKEVFKSIKLRNILHDAGFDYYTIGNVFLSIYYPVKRELECPACGTRHNAKASTFYKFKQYKYVGKCPKQGCTYEGEFRRLDSKSVNINDINVVKWNPINVSVNHNPITGESEYYYKIPADIKRKIMLGDHLFVSTVPWQFIEAVRNNQDFKFDSNNIFHLKNISTGQVVEGTALPPLLSLFSLVYYQAVLRKANESIAQEHLTPMRVVSPAPGSGNSDPSVAMNMRNFVSNMEHNFKLHKKDRNHIVIAPTPINVQNVGGEGRNLLVAQEIAQAEESILLSLGVSRELLSGSTNWTSSTIGLRMLSNTMENYVSQINDLIEWVMTRIAAYLGITKCDVVLEPFKLSDDEVVKSFATQMASVEKMSMSTLYELYGMDFDDELKKMMDDKVKQAKNQIDTQHAVDTAHFVASKEINTKMREDSDYTNNLARAQQLAQELYNADEGVRRSTLHDLKVSDFTLYSLVSKILEQEKQSEQHQAGVETGKEEVANNVEDQGQQGEQPDDNKP